MKHALLVLALLAAFCGCRRTDIRTFEVSLPTATAADEGALKTALLNKTSHAPYDGLVMSSFAFDAAKKTVVIRYDSMQIAKKNIEMLFAEAGFEANGVTPASVGAKPVR